MKQERAALAARSCFVVGFRLNPWGRERFRNKITSCRQTDFIKLLSFIHVTDQLVKGKPLLYHIAASHVSHPNYAAYLINKQTLTMKDPEACGTGTVHTMRLGLERQA